uniref:Uncharacterized protein n=1 Tax=Chenopodium quinoa TaxID=63459 RepID=A0A803M2F7_CHEQI
MLQYNQQIVELHAEGSDDSGGYCTPDEQEEKGDVSMEGFGMVLAQSAYKMVQGVKVYAGLLENGKWELKIVELKHTNHIPTPSKALLVPKYRMAELERMSYVRRRLEFGDNVGISSSTMHNMLASERNSLYNMPFTKMDLHNLRARQKKLKFKDERLVDGNSAVYLRGLVTDFKIEETFRNVYTDAKFVEVQRECKRLMYCNCSSINKELGEGCYEHIIKDIVCVYSDFDKKEKPINRHCINALEVQQISDVPKKYILDSEKDEALTMVIAGLKELEMKPTLGGIKDPPTNRGLGCVRSSRFMTTFEEVCRQKEAQRKHYDKKRRKDRAKQREQGATEQLSHQGVTTLASEDMVGNYLISTGCDSEEHMFIPEDELI